MTINEIPCALCGEPIDTELLQTYCWVHIDATDAPRVRVHLQCPGEVTAFECRDDDDDDEAQRRLP